MAMLLVYLFDDMVDGKEYSIDTILLTAKIAVYIFDRLQEIFQGFNNLPQDRIPINIMYKHSVMIW